MNEKETYLKIGKAVGGEESQMFGKPCFKINKKAFVSFFDECMVFKLPKPTHTKALNLSGSKLSDPSRKGRPMKEWVQVPFDYSDQWEEFATAALEYVKSQNK